MSNFKEVQTTTVTDVDGVETTTKVEKSTNITRNEEPDYIKIYTNMWAEFNGVPLVYRELFLQLATRMTYCNSDDLGNAQLVNTGKPFSDSIKKALKWKDDMLYRGLRELVKIGAIKKVGRGVYQVNPQYAGKGEWKYNPRLERGGVEELVMMFKVDKDGNKTVKTEIIWADNGENTDFNEMYRDGLGFSAEDEAILKHTVITAELKQESRPPQNEDCYRYGNGITVDTDSSQQHAKYTDYIAILPKARSRNHAWKLATDKNIAFPKSIEEQDKLFAQYGMAVK